MLGLMHGLLALTFPLDCLSCGELAQGEPFCEVCRRHLVPRDGPRCQICDARVAAPQTRCGRCVAEPPPFERAWALFDYIGPVGDAIRAGKYDNRPEAMPAVGRLLAANLPPGLEGAGAVVPVPLHPRRLARRKIDAPLLLARIAAKRLGLPCLPRGLQRVKDTRPQAGLTERERRENVRGAFAIGRARPPPEVLLVDDVMTTGATVRAAAAVLREAGVARVRVLTVAVAERLA